MTSASSRERKLSVAMGMTGFFLVFFREANGPIIRGATTLADRVKADVVPGLLLCLWYLPRADWPVMALAHVGAWALMLLST